MRLIFLGPPGAGKGTQAVVLSKEFGLAHISTGDILREALKKGTELGLKAKKYMEKGELVPDDVVTGIVVERIKNLNSPKGFILDGYPRTEAQALSLEDELDKLNIPMDRVIYFKTSPEVSISRLSGRRVCKRCGMNYHIKNIPPRKEGICDNCSGELIQREDDKEETVRNRLKVYEEQTRRLLSYYDKKKILRTVSGDFSVEDVFEKLSALFREENLLSAFAEDHGY